ncbi:MAG: hypothetical protein D6679_08520 [Candidatus Hydrogenedentota bacterium]|nr:MAG: hypothetical protein D6679_08520 [Candidatus Hydrogenedentota bacterium]
MKREIGTSGFKFNVSAFRRFVESGFNPEAAKIKRGDTLVSFDWAQPLSVSLMMGTSSGAKRNNVKRLKAEDSISLQLSRIFSLSHANSVLESVSAGVDTLAEQPLLTGIRRALRTDKASEMLLEIGASVPASLAPSFLYQVNQMLDNTWRETRNDKPKTVFQAASINTQPRLRGLTRPLESSEKLCLSLF